MSKNKAVDAGSEELVDAMLQAAVAGKVEEVKRLLRRGVDPNVRGEFRYSPLMRAAEHDREDVFFTLLVAGADRHAWRLDDLEPVLKFAVLGRSKSRVRMFEAIVDHASFDPKCLSKSFHMACKLGSKAIVKKLIEAGSGVKGQIITMKHETGQHKLLAASLRDWLDRLANDLEAGKFEYQEGKGLV